MGGQQRARPRCFVAHAVVPWLPECIGGLRRVSNGLVVATAEILAAESSGEDELNRSITVVELPRWVRVAVVFIGAREERRHQDRLHSTISGS